MVFHERKFTGFCLHDIQYLTFQYCREFSNPHVGQKNRLLLYLAIKNTTFGNMDPSTVLTVTKIVEPASDFQFFCPVFHTSPLCHKTCQVTCVISIRYIFETTLTCFSFSFTYIYIDMGEEGTKMSLFQGGSTIYKRLSESAVPLN